MTAVQATALLDAFVGDSGSGGTKGLVPAPSSGDAGKYLDGNGTFTTTNTAFNKNFGTSAGTVLEGNTSPSGIGAVPTSRTLTAGVGLSGGGDLTVDRTFDMANTAVSAGSYTTTNLTVDAQGRITAASSGTAGATTFDALTDTPSSKSGQAGKAPLVNGGETALEYIDLGGIYQPLDATLTTIAATNPTTDQINYFTGTNVASVTSLTSFARTLLDDTTQGAMQTTLNVDPAGTDNSTNVTLAGSLDYLTLSGQEITRNAIDLTTDVSGDLPVADGGTGSSTASGARTNLDVDQAGTDNSTNVTLAGTPNYITIVGQVITRALINLTSHVTGILPLANGGTGSSTLTASEVSQIENIGTTTISGTQWGYLGAFNQGLTTSSSVTFGGVTVAVGNKINLTTTASAEFISSYQAGILDIAARGGIENYSDTNNNDGATSVAWRLHTGVAATGSSGAGVIATITKAGNATYAGNVVIGDLGVLSTGKQLYFDGGSNTFIDSSTGTNLRFAANGTANSMTLSSGGVLTTTGGIISQGDVSVSSSGYVGQIKFGSNDVFRLTSSGTSTADAEWILSSWDGSGYNPNFTIDGNTHAVAFAGAVTKASGAFNIAHPLASKVKTHRLVHSFVESPRAENLYSGMATLIDGVVSVNIDAHSNMTEGTFQVLNTMVTHSSSNESGYSPVKCSVIGNIITIDCQDKTSTDTVYWEVRGERKDQHMLETEWTDDEGHVIVEPEIKIE